MPDILDTLCIVCGSSDLAALVELTDIPAVANQLLDSSTEARQVAMADIRLVGCRHCGHVFNAAFDLARVVYDGHYENSLMGSPRYRRFTEEIIDRLLSAHDLAGGTAVEVGCGRGEFLRMLCRRGLHQGIGFDPCRPDSQETIGDATITIIGDVFVPSRAPDTADIVCSRHVLEHLPEPVELLRTVREAYASSPAKVVFLEVPNGGFMLEELGVWDPLYEHVSYFTASSLAHALRLAGFVPGPIQAVFGKQFLTAEAAFPASDQRRAALVSAEAWAFDGFGDRFATTVQAWRDWLQLARQQGRRLALWGAGAKGITFLNVLDRSEDRAVAQVVDINPLKAGAFIAGTGHPIVLPAALQEHRPDMVLVMNPEYESEIRQTLDGLGLDVELVAISGRMPPTAAESSQWLPPRRKAAGR